MRPVVEQAVLRRHALEGRFRGGRAGPLRRARARPAARTVRVGVDTGGTFTDLVAVVGGELRRHKVPSTPENPATAVRRGLAGLLGERAADLVSYGTTVATNTLLERRGARVALVTNRGFEDVIEIGRQDRRELYATNPSRARPLVPRGRRIGIDERTGFDGVVERPARPRELAALARRLRDADVEAVAVGLLHAYANPTSERAVGRALAPLGLPLTLSHEVSAEYREVERFSTAVVNAYVVPRVASHLAELERAPEIAGLRVLESNGVGIGPATARREPVRTVLSGPAAGVVGATTVAARIGVERFVTFDMGGTSTDVALVDGRPGRRPLGEVGGHPIRMPMIDIHTVGAGGGSIARIDAGGALKVGPRSAGALPGPACYGRGVEPTVTDANLVLGRLVADRFLGGGMKLDAGRASSALARIARPFGGDLARAAEGVVAVADAAMERAIRTITIERGVDPRELVLVAFGGAGPLHAASVARVLGIRRIVLPADPGLLCALGALVAPWGRETALTLRAVDPAFGSLRAAARRSEARLRKELAVEPGVRGRIAVESSLDVRYAGQSYEIEVPLAGDFASRFHRAHEALFGHASPEVPIEVVTLRVRALAAEPAPPALALRRARSRPVPAARTRARLDGGEREVPIYERETLGAGARIRGPAIVAELSATSWVPPEVTARADGSGNLHLEVA